jgi:hypothetical protein
VYHSEIKNKKNTYDRNDTVFPVAAVDGVILIFCRYCFSLVNNISTGVVVVLLLEI